MQKRLSRQEVQDRLAGQSSLAGRQSRNGNTGVWVREVHLKSVRHHSMVSRQVADSGTTCKYRGQLRIY
jgi:hypothetical protein